MIRVSTTTPEEKRDLQGSGLTKIVWYIEGKSREGGERSRSMTAVHSAYQEIGVKD